MNHDDVPFIISEAQCAGEQGMQQTIPKPMVVQDGSTRYVVPSGVCGFATVNVPGVRSNSKLGKELIKHGFYKNSYERCLQYSVHRGGQSMELKEAYAEEFARTLRRYGIDAYSTSRMD
jgi:hypothetical protein